MALAPQGKLIGRALEDDRPLVDQGDLAAGGADVLDQMRADDHRGALAERAQQAAKGHALLRVEPGGGLVQE